MLERAGPSNAGRAKDMSPQKQHERLPVTNAINAVLVSRETLFPQFPNPVAADAPMASIQAGSIIERMRDLSSPHEAAQAFVGLVETTFSPTNYAAIKDVDLPEAVHKEIAITAMVLRNYVSTNPPLQAEVNKLLADPTSPVTQEALTYYNKLVTLISPQDLEAQQA